jgi:acid phosphatase (class A)
MRGFVAAAALAATLLAAGVAQGQAERPKPYLAAGAINGAAFLPVPPSPGSATQAADTAAYRDALSVVGTPRWAQATADDDDSTEAVYRNYACALDAGLHKGMVPTLDRVLDRTWADAVQVSEAAKPSFQRPRPFVGDDPNTPLCIAMSPERRAKPSTSYPSGHATLGFLRGLILAELAPDQADPVMARTQSFVESRRICRVHHASDLDAGRVLAAALYARLQASPEFRDDMEKARAELAAARAAAAAPAQGCAA